MANAIWSGWKQLVGRHGIGISQTLPPGFFSVGLVSTGYTFSQADDFLDDVGLANLLASQQMGAGTTFTGRTLDGPDVTFPNVAGGSTVRAVILFMDHRATTANGSTSRLMAYFDTIPGLPLGTNGQTITLTWDSVGILDL